MQAARANSDSWRAASAWLAVLAAAFVALAATGYRARDADSRLYAEISARLSTQAVPRWIAPEFPPGWYMSGLFREHPAGLFFPAAALASLGYPAEQAAYAMNAVYQVLGIVLLQRLAATCAPPLESRALGWLIQLLPIAFTFRIRANHEAALLMCLLAALYGTDRTRRDAHFWPLVAAGFVGLLLVKGLLSVFGPLLCVLWLVIRRLTSGTVEAPDRSAWLGVAAGVGAMGIAAAGYEIAYRQATGESFWAFYAARQLGVAAASEAHAGLVGKLNNLAWYLGRLLWFSFPWSLIALAALWQRRQRSGSVDGATAAGSRAAALLAAGVTLVYLAVFSLSDRRADRYIFPAYYAVGAAGAVAALRLLPRLRSLAVRLDQPYVPAAAWGLLFLAHLYAGRLGLPTVKL